LSQAATLFSKTELSSLQAEGPIPLYHQLYLLVKRRILNGSIPHGTKLPTEQHLADAFGVSRITAKRVMDLLAGDELIERKRGRGSHVLFQASESEVDAPLVGMLERLAGMSRSTQIKVLRVERRVPPARIVEELKCPADEEIHYIERVRSDKRSPFAYYESWTRGVVKGFTAREIGRRQRFAIMEESGLKISRIEQHLSAAAVAVDVAEQLELAPGDPVLTMVRHSFDENGDIVDLLYAQYHPERFHYRMNLSADDYAGGYSSRV